MGENADFHSDAGGSRIIGRILPVAVRLWLLSQVERVDELSLQLEGRDRDIITGYLPKVSVSAEQAVYRGIHLSQVQLSAIDIRINVGQVIRGKPLRLLKGFPVLGTVALTAGDLTASLTSPLLAEGLESFWRSLLLQNPALVPIVAARYGQLPLHSKMSFERSQICLGDQSLGLSFYPHALGKTAPDPIILGTKLTASGNLLQLKSPRWLKSLADLSNLAQGEPIETLDGFQWNLGRDVQLTQLALCPSQLLCQGQISVNP